MDKRIQKTKDNFRATLSQLIQEKPFEKINVKEICERAHTSRVTFYTYYGDKYDLLSDLFDSIKEQVKENFKTLQEKTNPSNSFVTSLKNILTAVMTSESASFSTTYLVNNMDMTYFYFRFLMDCVGQFEIEYPQESRTSYPLQKINAFIVLGLWGFLHVDDGKTTEKESMDDVMHLIEDIASSNIFQHDK